VVNGVGRTIRALVRRGQAPRPAGGLGGQAAQWSITYLDWQKEGGVRTACRAVEPVE
jgi:hypothetical protein